MSTKWKSIIISRSLWTSWLKQNEEKLHTLSTQQLVKPRNRNMLLQKQRSFQTHGEQSIPRRKRLFTSSTIMPVIRDEIKDLSPLPFESHLSCATVKHRKLNITDLKSHHKTQGSISVESSSDTINNNRININETYDGLRIKRAQCQVSTHKEPKLKAVGGRLLRVSPKVAATSEDSGASIVASKSATAKYRQRHTNMKTRDIKKSNPSYITIVSAETDTKSNDKVLEKESSDIKSESKASLTSAVMLLLAGAGGIVYSGVIPF